MFGEPSSIDVAFSACIVMATETGDIEASLEMLVIINLKSKRRKATKSFTVRRRSEARRSSSTYYKAPVQVRTVPKSVAVLDADFLVLPAITG